MEVRLSGLIQDQGQQSNDSAVGQASPEQIEEFIRGKYHSRADGKLSSKDD